MGMIVALTGDSEKDFLRDAKKLVAHPFFSYLYGVEIRYDSLKKREEKLGKFLGELREILGEKKLIFTIRTERQGGYFPYDKSYFQLNMMAMESGYPDYIDLEVELGSNGRQPFLDCHAMILQLGGKCIASYHDFQKTPSRAECREILTALASYGTDTIKLACMPRKEVDVLNLMLASREWKDKNPGKNLICMSMGEMGKSSRILGSLSGSRHSFVQAFSASAPGQFGIEEYMELWQKMEGRKNIALIGFMGSGKSTLGERLAEMLSVPLVELDRRLEEGFSMRISQYFKQFGEERFRREESRLLREVLTEEQRETSRNLQETVIEDAKEKLRPKGREMGIILSPGGGIVLREENRKLLQEHCFTIYLQLSPKAVLERLEKEAENRPVLQNKLDIHSIEKIMEERESLYQACADGVLSVEGKTVETCLEEVLRILREEGLFSTDSILSKNEGNLKE